jgi:hypothetical protein
MKCGTKKTKKYAEGGEVDDQRDAAKRRSMIAQKGSAKTKSDMRKASEEVRTQRKTNEAYEGYYDRKPAAKKAMGGMMTKGYAEGGMVKARGMGAATRGGKCKMS